MMMIFHQPPPKPDSVEYGGLALNLKRFWLN